MRRLIWLVKNSHVVLLFELLRVDDEQVTKVVVVFAIGFVHGFPSDGFRNLTTPRFTILTRAEPFHVFSLRLAVLAQPTPLIWKDAGLVPLVGYFHDGKLTIED